MEIAVQEFSGYSSFDNNHIYDLVVSLRVLKTVTDIRTPTPVVIAGVQHMLERALVLQGLTLLGHPSAAAFEVVMTPVSALIDATRDENKEKMDALELKLAEAADNIAVLGREYAAISGSLRAAQKNVMSLRDENETLRVEIDALINK